jgi:hypothetical protein
MRVIVTRGLIGSRRPGWLLLRTGRGGADGQAGVGSDQGCMNTQCGAGGRASSRGHVHHRVIPFLKELRLMAILPDGCPGGRMRPSSPWRRREDPSIGAHQNQNIIADSWDLSTLLELTVVYDLLLTGRAY